MIIFVETQSRSTEGLKVVKFPYELQYKQFLNFPFIKQEIKQNVPTRHKSFKFFYFLTKYRISILNRDELTLLSN